MVAGYAQLVKTEEVVLAFFPGSGYPGGAGALQVVLCALQVGQAAIAPGVK